MVERATAGRGMRVFLRIWSGELVSAIGSATASFALGVWIFSQRHSATQFALMVVIGGLTSLVVGPFAGAVVDRYERRRLLMLSNIAPALITAAISVLLYRHLLVAWHAYLIVAVMVALSAFHGPALLSSVRMLVPKDQLGRASGLTQVSTAVAQIGGPALAGALIGFIGFHGMFLVDCATFLFALATLIGVEIPRPITAATATAPPRRSSLLAGASQGWRYLRERRGLFALLVLFACVNFGLGIVQVLLTPLILSFASPAALGTVNACSAAGVLLGGLALSVWGGPRWKIWGVLGPLFVQGLILMLGGVRPSVPLVAAAAFTFMLGQPIVGGCSLAIWQHQVEPGIMGRVLTVRQMAASATMLIAALTAGTLADRVFEPLMAKNGALAASVGRWIGTGPGRGIGLLIMLVGLALLVTATLAILNPRLREVEREPRETGTADDGPAAAADR